jgi:hypothetical protein
VRDCFVGQSPPRNDNIEGLLALTFPRDYAERVYAGVLGKIIGVYLGRPFEGWTHEQILAT